MSRRIIVFGFVAVMFSLLLANTSMAATGVENITLSNYSASVLPGGKVIVNYTLKLVSGYYSFGTTLYIVNNKQLIARNVSVILNSSFGNPTLNGIMYVFLTHTTSPGTYNVTLAGNSTGVTVNPGTLVLNVPSSSQNSTSLSTKPTTSVPASSSAPATTVPQTTALSTVPSTIAAAAQNAPNGGGAIYYIIAIIIVIVIVVWLVSSRGKGGGKKQEAQQQQAKQQA